MRSFLSPESSAAAEGRPVALRREAVRPMCPRCLCRVNRMPRGAVDRLISLVVPVRRYRCRALACAWEGALRNSRFEIEPGDDARHDETRMETR